MIKNRILKYDMVNWRELVPFQPQNLKKNERHKIDKLVRSYRQTGKITPFAIWETDGKKYVIDGHATLDGFQIIEGEGEHVEDMQPALWLDIKNEKEAKKFVLIYNSRYRELNDTSLKKFIGDMNVDELLGTVQLELDLKKLFEEKFENDEPKYPIVPQYSEKYHAVLIVVDNDIDFTNLCEKLGLGMTIATKRKHIGTTKVITYKQFEERWRS